MRKKIYNKACLYKRRKKKVIKDMTSKSEKFILDSLESTYGIKIERQFKIGTKYFDARHGLNILEIDGTRWHSSKKDLKNDNFKDNIATRNGFTIYRIKLDRVKDVPKILEENKELFKKIFNV